MIKRLLTVLILISGIYHINVIAEEKMMDTMGKNMQEPMSKVNVNTASAEELSTNLNGVGEITAQEIVAYRKSKGKFKNADDLIEVKNIGEWTIKRNKDIIVYE
jgi:competence ComEA-like helix-hairpin-helix protein